MSAVASSEAGIVNPSSFAALRLSHTITSSTHGAFSEDAARRMIEMGFTHLIFGLPPAKADKVLPLLDQYAALAEKLRH